MNMSNMSAKIISKSSVLTLSLIRTSFDKRKKKKLIMSHFGFCQNVFNSIQFIYICLRRFVILFWLDVFKVVCNIFLFCIWVRFNDS